MPVNNWKHVLTITDLIEPLQQSGEPFDTARAELVSRIRAADFYAPEDRVLAALVNDLESAGNTVHLRDLNLFMLWGDQDQRVWVEHIS